MKKTCCLVSILLGVTTILAWNSSGEPAPIGGAFQVNVYTTSWQDRPSIAADANGDLLVVWESRGQDGEFEGVYGRRYDSSGAPVSGEMPLNSFTASSQGTPKLLFGPLGPVIVWRDGAFDGDQGTIMLKLPGDDEFQVNTYTTGNHQYPDLAMDDDGEFVVVWENGGNQDGDGRGIFGQRFDAGGGFVGPEFMVNTTTGGSQDRPAADGIGDGRFVVVWNADAGGDDQVMAQRFASDGMRVGAEITVNAPSYNNNEPDVAMADDGSFVVVWRSYVAPSYEVYSRRFNSSGNPTTAILPVAAAPGLGGFQPAIRRDPNGRFLVLWNNGLGELRARELGSDGIALADDIAFADGGFRGDVAFTQAAEYSGLVTWVESGTDGDSLGVFARRIGSAEIFTDGFESGNTGSWSATVN